MSSRISRRSIADGFTLIELQVAVALLGIIAAISVSFMWIHRRRSFDAQALTDLRNIAAGEEPYFVDNREYVSVSCPKGGTLCSITLPGVATKSVAATVNITAIQAAPNSPATFSGIATAGQTGTGKEF